MTPYIICYFVTGSFLTASAWINGVFAYEKRFAAGLITLLLWPLLILVAPESFFQKAQTEPSPTDELKLSLGKLLEPSEAIPLSETETRHFKGVVEQGESGVVYFGASAANIDILNEFWDSNIPPSIYYDVRSARRALETPEPDSGTRFSLQPPYWYIGFSNEFLKSIGGVDRKLRGRILEAISDIGDAPMTPVGDTIKPLTGDLSGLWRCRVGDYRLIYFPHSASQRITLICFGPRGNIYENLPNTTALTKDASGPSTKNSK